MDWLAGAVIALAFVAQTPVPEARLPRVAVMPLSAPNLDEATRRALDKVLLVALDNERRFKTVSPGELDALLGRERMQELSGCPPESVACAAEIVGALGTRYLVVGSVDVLEDQRLITLSLVDSNRLEAVARTQTTSAKDPAQLVSGVQQSVKGLLARLDGGMPAPAKGAASTTGANGDTVSQPDSGVVWQRCVLGQAIDKGGCRGEARKVNWAAASRACPTGLRLPRLDELLGVLADCPREAGDAQDKRCSPCRASPVCRQLFDPRPVWTSRLDRTWSGDTFEGARDLVWTVNLSTGDVAVINATATAVVRCVRATANRP